MQVYVHLHLVLGTDFDNARLQLDLNDQPFLTLELGEDINTALNDQLTPFKNFKLEFTIIQRTLISDRRIEVVYFRKDKFHLMILQRKQKPRKVAKFCYNVF